MPPYRASLVQEIADRDFAMMTPSSEKYPGWARVLVVGSLLGLFWGALALIGYLIAH